MAITTIQSGASTIRIHDEMCDSLIEDCLKRLSTIVYESYMHRLLLPEIQSSSGPKT